MEYGLITKRADLPAPSKQRKLLAKCERILDEPTQEYISAIRSGQSLTVYSLKCFAYERSNGYQPRKNAMQLLEMLEQDGVTVHVINSGERYDMMNDAGRLSRDVLDALAGVRQVKQGRGRPKVPPPKPDDITEALGIWRDTVTYRIDSDARKAVKATCAYPWSDARIRKHLGKSGRKPGRR
jgi:hypothetical protein